MITREWYNFPVLLFITGESEAVSVPRDIKKRKKRKRDYHHYSRILSSITGAFNVFQFNDPLQLINCSSEDLQQWWDSGSTLMWLALQPCLHTATSVSCLQSSPDAHTPARPVPNPLIISPTCISATFFPSTVACEIVLLSILPR